MKAASELTRNHRYMIRAEDGGRVMRLSVSPKVADWYWHQYASAWPRRIAQDYIRIGTLDPRILVQHDDEAPGLVIRQPALIVRQDETATA